VEDSTLAFLEDRVEKKRNSVNQGEDIQIDTMEPDLETLKKKFADANQQHVFRFADQLSGDELHQLSKDLQVCSISD
jgi:hypothetical protein